MSKTPMIQVASGELYVFGKIINRHPNKPWLFCITDVHKACEKQIRAEAAQKGKNPDSYFKSKVPAQWSKRNITNDSVASVSKLLRSNIRKYGISCGFGDSVDSNVTAVTLLSNKDLCIHTVKGNTKLRGTYVAQDFIIEYAGFLNAKLKASVYNTFAAVLNGYTEEVTKKVEKNSRRAKGTEARKVNKDVNHRLGEACSRKSVLPIHVQKGINIGTLGMTAAKYMDKFCISEPFNDNITEAQVDMKNAGIAFATMRINSHKKQKLSTKEAETIGRESSERALFVHANPDIIDKLIAKSK